MRLVYSLIGFTVVFGIPSTLGSLVFPEDGVGASILTSAAVALMSITLIGVDND